MNKKHVSLVLICGLAFSSIFTVVSLLYFQAIDKKDVYSYLVGEVVEILPHESVTPDMYYAVLNVSSGQFGRFGQVGMVIPKMWNEILEIGDIYEVISFRNGFGEDFQDLTIINKDISVTLKVN